MTPHFVFLLPPCSAVLCIVNALRTESRRSTCPTETTSPDHFPFSLLPSRLVSFPVCYLYFFFCCFHYSHVKDCCVYLILKLWFLLFDPSVRSGMFLLSPVVLDHGHTNLMGGHQEQHQSFSCFISNFLTFPTESSFRTTKTKNADISATASSYLPCALCAALFPVFISGNKSRCRTRV